MVTAPAAKTIPIRTPFTLTGSATDADDGDTLTYLWEQTDAGGLPGTGLVDNTKPTGRCSGMFGVAAQRQRGRHAALPLAGREPRRHLPSRTFPDLAQVLAGNTNAETGTCPARRRAGSGSAPVPPGDLDCYSEFLPTGDWVGNPPSPRVLHFRLTARDEFTADAAADHAGGLSSADVALTLDADRGPVPGHLAGQQRTPRPGWRR